MTTAQGALPQPLKLAYLRFPFVLDIPNDYDHASTGLSLAYIVLCYSCPGRLA